MRVAIVTESFLPQVNGVSNTVHQVATHLQRSGHHPLVIAPGRGPLMHQGIPVVRTRSVPLPRYSSFPLGLPDPAVQHAIEGFAPHVVHLASPFALGAVGLNAALRLAIPTVAVYQTDVAGFARHYGLPGHGVVDRWVGRIHRRCDRTLVPSTSSLQQLRALRVPGLELWRRGVDVDQFRPDNRCEQLHASWRRRPSGDAAVAVVGYVGRLAAEKQVRRLTELGAVPGVRLVVIGDGPERARLEKQLPDAVFTGMLHGAALARAFASLDVFVHTGESETFCQTVQEAQASGVPVVAPAAGGPVDLIHHRHTGLLFDPHDPVAFRRSVARLTWDAALRRTLAEAAITQVQERSWDRVVHELVTLHYAAVLSPCTGRGAA